MAALVAADREAERRAREQSALDLLLGVPLPAGAPLPDGGVAPSPAAPPAERDEEGGR